MTTSSTTYPVPSFSSTTLPSGVTLVDNGNGTATLTYDGTSTPAAKSYRVTIKATNSAGTASQTFTLIMYT